MLKLDGGLAEMAPLRSVSGFYNIGQTGRSGGLTGMGSGAGTYDPCSMVAEGLG